MILDDVFGDRFFRSEIIWYYRRWSNSRVGLLPTHQTMLYYAKTDDFVFNPQRTDYSPSTNVDQILQQRVRDSAGKTTYKRDGKGRTVSNGAKHGVPLGDVWDIPYLNPKAKERSGYPTQKPIELLDRVLRIATNEGDSVLDPFCGSGTTLVAAQLMRRTFIGIDVSIDAVELSRERLRNPVRTRSNLLARGRVAYRNADDYASSLLRGIPFVAVQRNKGIDAILKQSFKGAPITVRVQHQNETIAEAGAKLKRASETKHAQLMFLVVTQRGAGLAYGDDVPGGVTVVPAVGTMIQDHLGQCITASQEQAVTVES